MDTAKVLIYKNATKYSPQMFSQYLAYSQFNRKKKRIIITPGIEHLGFHCKKSGEELGWCWRGVPKIEGYSQHPRMCPKPARRNQQHPKTPAQTLPRELLCHDSREVTMLRRQSLAWALRAKQKPHVYFVCTQILPLGIFYILITTLWAG